jgi:mortality factor 4-like protein 1
MSETPVKRELQAGDTVFAFHGPLIYEAKILRIHRAGSATVETTTETEAASKFPKLTNLMDIDTYFLHYQGWNSKWDEWVGIERILEYNEENIFKKKELDQLTKRRASKPAKESSVQPSSQSNTSQSSKLGTNTSKVTKPRKKKVPTIHLNFHNSLKYILVDDWQFITRDRKLVSLPSEYPVEFILLEYKKFRLKKLDDVQQNVLQEILTGLQLYFNKSLSLILLYKYENLQYLQLLKNNVVNKEVVPSKVYGVEHLLRLLTSLPGLISQTEMDGVSIGVLISEMDNLLQWLADNLKQYLGKYENTSPLYDSLARS